MKKEGILIRALVHGQHMKSEPHEIRAVPICFSRVREDSSIELHFEYTAVQVVQCPLLPFPQSHMFDDDSLQKEEHAFYESICKSISSNGKFEAQVIRLTFVAFRHMDSVFNTKDEL